MKDFFKDYLTKDEAWLIREEEWNSSLQGARESQFTLGNGYMGIRGALEEQPYDSYAGTYIAGIYDKAASQVVEMVNLPNPLSFKITSNEEKLDVGATNILEHNRTLDMKKGTLFRKTIYSNRFKKRIAYYSMRFLSMRDKGLGVMRIFVTPLDNNVELIIQNTIDTSVTNKGLLTEGRKTHFNIDEIHKAKDVSFLSIRTFDNRIPICYAATLEVRKDGHKHYTSKDSFKIKVKKGETVTLTKLFFIDSLKAENGDKLKKHVLTTLKKCMRSDFDKLFNLHVSEWKKKWQIANIDIEGDKELERTLRFNTYHLLICSMAKNRNASIGARTLSGEGYRGHIFWDTEIFILPFFIFTNPVVAKNLLLYRYNRLNEAKMIAQDKGFEGALFPWESADTGYDVTPTWSKDLDGSIIKITTNEYEHHISADVAYAVYYYYNVTGDINFLLKHGLEIIFETARFWASRVEYNKKSDSYHIKHVTGPDEFHENIDDNAYTNGLAKWNLARAAELYRRLKKEYPKEIKSLCHNLKLKPLEIKSWNSIAARISLIESKKTKIIEQFKGFFKKRYVKIREIDSNFMPVIPRSVALRKMSDTQLVKQADVVMLLYLLSSVFNLKRKKKNFYFYNSRTVHKSSLSPSIHSILAANIKDLSWAYRYFAAVVATDLKNIHGNTDEGVHAASLGGCWQAVVNGFAGICIKKGVLCIDPLIPYSWKELKFAINFRGFRLNLNISREKLNIYVQSKRKRQKLIFKLCGKPYEILNGERKIIEYSKRRR